MTDEQNEAPEPVRSKFLTADEILNANEPAVVVELPGLGKVHLRPANLHDLGWLRNAVRDLAEPRDLALAVLARSWAPSEVSADRTGEMRDGALAVLVRAWLDHAVPLEEGELNDLQGIHGAVRGALGRWDEEERRFLETSISRTLASLQADQKKMQAALDRMGMPVRLGMISDIYPHFKAVQQLAGIQGMVGQRGELVRGAERRVDELLSGSGVNRVMLGMLADQERLRASTMRGILAPLEMTEAITRAYAGAASALGSTIQGAIRSLPQLQETAARTLTMQGVIQQAVDRTSVSPAGLTVLDGLTAMTGSVTEFWNGLAEDPKQFAHVTERERKTSVAQVFHATKSVGLLLTDEEELVEEELVEDEPTVSLLAAEAGAIVPRLERIDPALVPVYSGVHERFKQKGNDYVRQTAASMRALFESLLPRIAPDAEIAAWKPESLPDKGPVSYKARLAYIFRHPGGRTGYERMTENDVLHVEQSLILLDEQVHRLKPTVAEEVLQEMLIRWEFSLQHVLRVYDQAQRQE